MYQEGGAGTSVVFFNHPHFLSFIFLLFSSISSLHYLPVCVSIKCTHYPIFYYLFLFASSFLKILMNAQKMKMIVKMEHTVKIPQENTNAMVKLDIWYNPFKNGLTCFETGWPAYFTVFRLVHKNLEPFASESEPVSKRVDPL